MAGKWTNLDMAFPGFSPQPPGGPRRQGARPASARVDGATSGGGRPRPRSTAPSSSPFVDYAAYAAAGTGGALDAMCDVRGAAEADELAETVRASVAASAAARQFEGGVTGSRHMLESLRLEVRGSMETLRQDLRRDFASSFVHLRVDIENSLHRALEGSSCNLALENGGEELQVRMREVTEVRPPLEAEISHRFDIMKADIAEAMKSHIADAVRSSGSVVAAAAAAATEGTRPVVDAVDDLRRQLQAETRASAACLEAIETLSRRFDDAAPPATRDALDSLHQWLRAEGEASKIFAEASKRDLERRLDVQLAAVQALSEETKLVAHGFSEFATSSSAVAAAKAFAEQAKQELEPLLQATQALEGQMVTKQEIEGRLDNFAKALHQLWEWLHEESAASKTFAAETKNDLFHRLDAMGPIGGIAGDLHQWLHRESAAGQAFADQAKSEILAHLSRLEGALERFCGQEGAGHVAGQELEGRLDSFAEALHELWEWLHAESAAGKTFAEEAKQQLEQRSDTTHLLQAVQAIERRLDVMAARPDAAVVEDLRRWLQADSLARNAFAEEVKQELEQRLDAVCSHHDGKGLENLRQWLQKESEAGKAFAEDAKKELERRMDAVARPGTHAVQDLQLMLLAESEACKAFADETRKELEGRLDTFAEALHKLWEWLHAESASGKACAEEAKRELHQRVDMTPVLQAVQALERRLDGVAARPSSDVPEARTDAVADLRELFLAESEAGKTFADEMRKVFEGRFDNFAEALHELWEWLHAESAAGKAMDEQAKQDLGQQIDMTPVLNAIQALERRFDTVAARPAVTGGELSVSVSGLSDLRQWLQDESEASKAFAENAKKDLERKLDAVTVQPAVDAVHDLRHLFLAESEAGKTFADETRKELEGRLDTFAEALHELWEWLHAESAAGKTFAEEAKQELGQQIDMKPVLNAIQALDRRFDIVGARPAVTGGGEAAVSVYGLSDLRQWLQDESEASKAFAENAKRDLERKLDAATAESGAKAVQELRHLFLAESEAGKTFADETRKELEGRLDTFAEALHELWEWLHAESASGKAFAEEARADIERIRDAVGSSPPTATQDAVSRWMKTEADAGRALAKEVKQQLESRMDAIATRPIADAIDDLRRWLQAESAAGKVVVEDAKQEFCQAVQAIERRLDSLTTSRPPADGVEELRLWLQQQSDAGSTFAEESKKELERRLDAVAAQPGADAFHELRHLFLAESQAGKAFANETRKEFEGRFDTFAEALHELWEWLHAESASGQAFAEEAKRELQQRVDMTQVLQALQALERRVDGVAARPTSDAADAVVDLRELFLAESEAGRTFADEMRKEFEGRFDNFAEALHELREWLHAESAVGRAMDEEAKQDPGLRVDMTPVFSAIEALERRFDGVAARRTENSAEIGDDSQAAATESRADAVSDLRRCLQAESEAGKADAAFVNRADSAVTALADLRGWLQAESEAGKAFAEGARKEIEDTFNELWEWLQKESKSGQVFAEQTREELCRRVDPAPVLQAIRDLEVRLGAQASRPATRLGGDQAEAALGHGAESAATAIADLRRWLQAESEAGKAFAEGTRKELEDTFNELWEWLQKESKSGQAFAEETKGELERRLAALAARPGADHVADLRLWLQTESDAGKPFAEEARRELASRLDVIASRQVADAVDELRMWLKSESDAGRTFAESAVRELRAQQERDLARLLGAIRGHACEVDYAAMFRAIAEHISTVDFAPVVRALRENDDSVDEAVEASEAVGAGESSERPPGAPAA